MARNQRTHVISIDSVDQWKALREASTKTDKLMVVEFKASWCDVCTFIEPTVQELAVKYERAATFVQINMDSESLLDIARQFKVTGYPTFILMMKGKQVDKLVGTNREDLEKKIEKNANFSATGDATGQIITLHSLDEWKNHLKTFSNKLIVAGFMASWCCHSRNIEPSVKEFANIYRDVKFFEFDMASPPREFEGYADQLQVSGYPTFILIKNEKQVDRVIGANKDELKKKIEKHSRPI